MGRKARYQPYFNLIKVLVGLVLLVISLRGADWTSLAESLLQTSGVGLLTLAGAVSLGLILKITRSIILLQNFGSEISFSRTAEAFFLGQAANILLPSRAGDILRLGYLSANQPTQLTQVTAAVILEKFLDLIAMTAVALGVSAYMPLERASWVRSWLLPSSILGSAGLVITILWGPLIWSKFRSRLTRRVGPGFTGFLTWVDRFVAASLWLRNPRRLLLPVILTLLIWGVMWETNMVLFRSLSLQAPLLAGGLVLILGYIGVVPNLMPGNVGPFYFFVQLSMQPFGISQENGLAYTVILHAMVTLVPLVASGVSMLGSESVRKTFTTLWKSP